ncbi:hypothetical protein [Lachnoclostridium sp. An181]|nr:hypothetical protein [Lachnoclostridium sp. An181]
MMNFNILYYIPSFVARTALIAKDLADEEKVWLLQYVSVTL